MANGSYETVKIERDEGVNAGIAWVILNRPEKRNAMSPQLHFDMVDVGEGHAGALLAVLFAVDEAGDGL
jgi:feruloyl-CoA hydratase/lyase